MVALQKLMSSAVAAAEEEEELGLVAEMAAAVRMRRGGWFL